MSKTNLFVIIDFIIGTILLFFGIIYRQIRKIFQVEYSSKKILVIKILGAGNFLAINKIINKKDIYIITSKENVLCLKKINPRIKIYEIDTRNFLTLFFSIASLFFKLLNITFSQVINLESESRFAKFLCSICNANKISGISNKNKSITDVLIYDNYLVGTNFLNKTNLINQLFRFTKKTNLLVKSLVENQQNFFLPIDAKSLSVISLTPSCSETDNLRRLSNSNWEYVLKQLLSIKSVERIKIIFSDKNDLQYSFFELLGRKNNKIEILVTNYDQFIDNINNCDLLLTIDSQALHLGQKFSKPTICFYGPTNPFSINIVDSTFPIYQSLECSPCTHKYYKVPCSNKAPCMKFSKSQLSINKLPGIFVLNKNEG